MSKPVILSPEKWNKLKQRLLTDYPQSVVLIRQRTRDVLGFVPREFEEWNTDTAGYWDKKRDVRLDFYNEPKRTMFVLKYSEYLDKSGFTDT